MKRILASTPFVFLILWSCAFQSANSQNLAPQASALTKLSRAVETTLLLDNPSPDLSEQELLELATRRNPEMLVPFKEYKIHVLREGSHAILLVCDKTETQGLLEDAGCTPGFDNRLLQRDPPVPCEFTLSPAEVCGP